MPNSKLKQYVDIAKSLTEFGPLTFDQLKFLLKVNLEELTQDLDFLVDQKMVKVKKINPQATYTIGIRGIRVLEFFKVVPSIKIADKH